MISPDEIQAKLARLYPQAVEAWLSNNPSFFPYRVRANLSHPQSMSQVIAWVQALRQSAKETIGYGYRVEWRMIDSRSKGENRFPDAIWIDSLDDLALAISKSQEIKNLRSSVARIQTSLPGLDGWVIKHWRKLVGKEKLVGDLILVVRYLLEHPRPGCFPRELPIAIPTKLVGENQSLLSEWLDWVLPPESIHVGCDPRDFATRYGFRDVQDHVRLRILDENLVQSLRLPAAEISLLPEDIARLPVKDARVLIVENKINLLTLPRIKNGIAFGGLGTGITRIFGVDWLLHLPILYWGDIDVDGFGILALVRRRFPETKSLLMNCETITRWMHLTTPGNGRTPVMSSELTDAESRCFAICRDQDLRLEQEHIPQVDADREIEVHWPESVLGR